MIPLLAIGLGIPFLQGWLLVRLLLPITLRSRTGVGFTLSLAAGIGLGVSSLLYAGYRFLHPAGEVPGLLALDSLLILALLILQRKSGAFPTEDSTKPAEQLERVDSFIKALFALAIFVTALDFIIQLLISPDGKWDTFTIWNLHARFFARGGTHWSDYITPLIAWTHPDYPLLIPACVARGWQFAGHETAISPAMVSAVFTFGTAGILNGSIGALRSRRSGWLAGIVLLGARAFCRHGAWMYADVPLSYYIVAALAIAALKDDNGNNFTIWALAGLLCGFAAWTKNEGELFLGVYTLVSTFGLFSRSLSQRQKLQRACGYAAGIVPSAFLLIYFKTHYHIPNDLIAGQQGNMLHRLFDPDRRALILQFYGKEIVGFSRRPAGLVPLLCVYTALTARITGQRIQQALPALSVILLMLSGYFVIYLITPHDLRWHLQYSLNRLLLHLWPAFVFAVFLLVNEKSGSPVVASMK